jgi:hypothetical protein
MYQRTSDDYGLFVSSGPPVSPPVGITHARLPPAPVLQEAFVFTKPHANTEAVQELVRQRFAAVGIEVVSEGDIDGPTIDRSLFIDNHYYAIASKATLLQPHELNPPKQKFADKFGISWDDAIAAGKLFNAKDACAKLGVDAAGLDAAFRAGEAAGKTLKLGGGFYCGLIEVEGREPLYALNPFFMTMRAKFTAPSASIHYFVVAFDPEAPRCTHQRPRPASRTLPPLARCCRGPTSAARSSGRPAPPRRRRTRCAA